LGKRGVRTPLGVGRTGANAADELKSHEMLRPVVRSKRLEGGKETISQGRKNSESQKGLENSELEKRGENPNMAFTQARTVPTFLSANRIEERRKPQDREKQSQRVVRESFSIKLYQLSYLIMASKRLEFMPVERRGIVQKR